MKPSKLNVFMEISDAQTPTITPTTLCLPKAKRKKLNIIGREGFKKLSALHKLIGFVLHQGFVLLLLNDFFKTQILYLSQVSSFSSTAFVGVVLCFNSLW